MWREALRYLRANGKAVIRSSLQPGTDCHDRATRSAGRNQVIRQWACLKQRPFAPSRIVFNLRRRIKNHRPSCRQRLRPSTVVLVHSVHAPSICLRSAGDIAKLFLRCSIAFLPHQRTFSRWLVNILRGNDRGKTDCQRQSRHH